MSLYWYLDGSLSLTPCHCSSTRTTRTTHWTRLSRGGIWGGIDRPPKRQIDVGKLQKKRERARKWNKTEFATVLTATVKYQQRKICWLGCTNDNRKILHRPPPWHQSQPNKMHAHTPTHKLLPNLRRLRTEKGYTKVSWTSYFGGRGCSQPVSVGLCKSGLSSRPIHPSAVPCLRASQPLGLDLSGVAA